MENEATQKLREFIEKAIREFKNPDPIKRAKQLAEKKRKENKIKIVKKYGF